MKILSVSALILFAVFSRPALADVSLQQPSLVNASAPSDASAEWQKRSQATATWMWLDIYKATLFTQTGFKESKLLADDEPLKLELCYLKPIGRDDLVKGAEAVLDKNLADVLKQNVTSLHNNYVDVKPGDCYVLEYAPQTGTQLKLNDKLAFATTQKGFKSVYFGIWLGQNPLSDNLKEELLKPLEKSSDQTS